LLTSKTIAIVAALDREVSPLVKHWRIREEKYAGRTFRFYENENAVLVCGGIGPEAARRAAEAVIALYQPALICSAGFAGAANPNSKVGDILIPRRVIDSSDGSRTDSGTGEGILVSFAAIAAPQQKAKLRAAFNADAIDMEAAAVARAAAAHGIRFAAVKAISDASNFAIPPLDKFVNPDGTFNTAKFTFFVTPRPWMWRKVLQLESGSRAATRALCKRLAELVREGYEPGKNREGREFTLAETDDQGDRL
jgi:adenosylhomocysteine nucleosidase